MYLTLDQIKESLGRLEELHPFFGMSFLAFKEADIPVGSSREVVFSQLVDVILERHYRASDTYDGYYNPFQTSNPAKRWMAPRYGSTSLQRITTDTFGEAFFHKKNSHAWGWKSDYVSILKNRLGDTRIPAFDLAVWLYRNEKWPRNVSPELIRDRLFVEYKINRAEKQKLFTLGARPCENWLTKDQVSEQQLISVIGPPPGTMPTEGAALRFLDLKYIGPASHFIYEPSDRLNLITGDNSLGKTFLLESIWWVLTGQWLEGRPITPRKDVSKRKPMIQFGVNTTAGRTKNYSLHYNWDRQIWPYPVNQEATPGLVIYSRFDGSFAVWDPSRAYLSTEGPTRQGPLVFFGRRDIWQGVKVEKPSERDRWICNGLLRDWVSWQAGGSRYEQYYQALSSCLKTLSPSENEPLVPGEPTRLPQDALEVPTLRMPYGDVAVVHASAGVQRIISLAYIMVWAWNEHIANSQIIRRNPQRRLVLIIDEVEAHLHPRWQRVIVPSLLEVVAQLASEVVPQLHLATHSPLVLASTETVFDKDKDDLHHLKLQGHEVLLEELPFVKRGKADIWLLSEVFGLKEPRSVPAEMAIQDAKKLQLQEQPAIEAIIAVQNRLVQYLAQDDEFWARWNYFALKHGVQQ